MSSGQKLFIGVLGLAVLGVFGCVAVGLIYFSLQRGAPLNPLSLAMQATETATTAPTPVPTATALPSATPTATRTPTMTRTPTRAATSTRVVPLATATPAPTILADGAKRYVFSDRGFAISIPAEWETVQADSETFQALIARLETQDPEFAKLLKAQVASSKNAGILFWAFDLSPKGSPGTSVNVVVENLPFAISLDNYVAALLQLFEKVASVEKPIQHERVQLKSGAYEKMLYRVNVANASSLQIQTSVTQFVIVKEKQAYALTFSAAASSAAQYEAAFEKIASSFEFVIP